MLRQFSQHATGQFHRVAIGQAGRHCADRQRARRERGDLQAQGLQHVRAALGRGDFLCRRGKAGRDQQRLAGQARAGSVHLGLQPLIDDTFMRRVHVHDHQALRVLRQDVDAMQLAQRATQRPGRIGRCVRCVRGDGQGLNGWRVRSRVRPRPEQ